MPTYEYECPHCTNSEGTALRFDVRQTDYDNHIVRCPKCRSVARRLISAVHNTFGFRLTDRSLYGGVNDPKDEYERAI